MTFTEYLNQADPQRQLHVEVTNADTAHISLLNRKDCKAVITLQIHDKCFYYFLKNDSDRLYTMDQDGNPKSSSCFVWVGRFSSPCPVCQSKNTKRDNDFPDTMDNCIQCGSEWNIEGEITFNSKDND
jgi:hypothetical protein